MENDDIVSDNERHRKIEEEQKAWEEKAKKESLPGFDPSWYAKTMDEIAEQIKLREMPTDKSPSNQTSA